MNAVHWVTWLNLAIIVTAVIITILNIRINRRIAKNLRDTRLMIDDLARQLGERP